MRLIIDLQICHSGSPSSNAIAAVRQAQALVRTAGSHEVWITLPTTAAEQLDLMRAAFAGLLPPDRVRAYALPLTAEGSAWQQRAAEMVRDNFLLGLTADLVYAPALFDGPANDAVCATRPADGLRTAYSVASDAVLSAPPD